MTDHHVLNEIAESIDDAQLPQQVAPGEIVIGTLAGLDNNGQALVDYPGNPLGKPVAAISAVSVTQAQIKRQVGILFANGICSKPVIVGLIHSPLHAILETSDSSPDTEEPENGRADIAESEDSKDGKGQVAYVDEDRVVIEGKKEIVLKCGDASITLTKAGKIIIRGTYLLNRSTGVNRIMGGSIQVN